MHYGINKILLYIYNNMSKDFNNSLKDICLKKPRIIFWTSKKCCGKTTFSNG